jgi:hypothetical protein
VRIGLSEIFVDERDHARAYYTPVLGSQVLVACIPRHIEDAQVMHIDGSRPPAGRLIGRRRL